MNRHSLRAIIATVALAIVAAACGGGDTTDETAQAADTTRTVAPSGDPAPTRSFQLFDGSEATFADFQGTPVVLNFWASWCPSCVAEMSAAFRPVQASLGEEVAFLGMNIQDERALAEQLLAETGVEWVSAEDPDGELYIDLGGLGMPFTVYIDAAGNIIHEHNGPLDERLLREQITEHLGVAS